MNARQVLILKLSICVMVAMLLFPPLVFKSEGGFQRNMGYGFLLSSNNGAVVNLGLLFMQWLAVLAVSAASLYFSATWIPESQQRRLSLRVGKAIAEGWRHSSFWRKFCLWMIALDITIAILQAGQGVTSSGARSVGWALIFVANFCYHTIRAFAGYPVTTHVGRKFSLKRVLLVSVVVALGLGAALLATDNVSQHSPFVYDDK